MAFLHCLGGFCAFQDAGINGFYPVLWSLLVVTTTDKISEVPIHSRRPWKAVPLLAESTFLQEVEGLTQACLTQHHPPGSVASRIHLPRSPGTARIIQVQGVCLAQLGGVGGPAPGRSASLLCQAPADLTLAHVLPGAFSPCSSRQPPRAHVASFSFTWGLLETRKAL